MMNPVSRSFILVLATVSSGLVSGQDKDEIPDGTSRAQPAPAIASVQAQPQAPVLIVEDLQRIVVLCATGQHTSELDRAWRKYLRSHYAADTDVDVLLQEVQRRATAYRTAMYVSPQQGTSEQDAQMSAIMKSLHDTAKAVIQNMR